MHNGKSIYQTTVSTFCKTTFLAFPRLAYLMRNLLVWAKQYYYVGSRNKPIIIIDLQLNLQNHINISCCNFNKYSMH